MTTFKNNIVLRTHLEHSESWQLEDRQMGRGRVSLRAKGQLFQASCFLSTEGPAVNAKYLCEIPYCADGGGCGILVRV